MSTQDVVNALKVVIVGVEAIGTQVSSSLSAVIVETLTFGESPSSLSYRTMLDCSLERTGVFTTLIVYAAFIVLYAISPL
jgi:hypothetical protein